jgi:hypothetical protein
MPFDPTPLALLSNAEILALAESRPGRDVLLALETIMLARIAARDEAAKASAKPARKSGATAETRRIRAAQRERRAAEKQAPAFFWAPDVCEAAGGNPLRAARRAGLLALGYRRTGEFDGYELFELGECERVIALGHFGALYCGTSRFQSIPREERDAITEAGKAHLAEMVEAAKVKAAEDAARRAEESARNAAEWQRRQRVASIAAALTKARASRQPAPMLTRYRRGKPVQVPSRYHPTREEARAAIRQAWQARRELRAA